MGCIFSNECEKTAREKKTPTCQISSKLLAQFFMFRHHLDVPAGLRNGTMSNFYLFEGLKKLQN
jgi:hypothetical protein